MTVLVLARDFDPTADAVVQTLTASDVPVFRTDLADFPTNLKIAAMISEDTWRGTLWNDHHRAELATVRSIWNRNPTSYRFPPSMTSSEQDFAYREAKLGFGGVLAALDALWVNHPHRCADAIHKPYQWKIATECGLDIAPTVITNDQRSAEHFARATTSITKGLGASGVVDDGQHHVAFTRVLTDEDHTDMRNVAVTATTLQTLIPKAHEVRLTVIGDHWFPVAIHTTIPAPTDWRADPATLRYEPITVPDQVASGVHAYMKRTNLVMAGWDFVVTPDGRWVMLEANTGPQFGWLEAATREPMVAALADVLAKGTP